MLDNHYRKTARNPLTWLVKYPDIRQHQKQISVESIIRKHLQKLFSFNA